ncbi:hypothetical protein ACGFU4_33180 [Streptomyces sp. NPDC048511]|uniref:hypothetical protein n=1 Tax=Streptomyces sp. NPDC048511 TaxID=3365562 RepID=UPI0037169348
MSAQPEKAPLVPAPSPLNFVSSVGFVIVRCVSTSAQAMDGYGSTCESQLPTVD